jgi:hypothetical protein
MTTYNLIVVYVEVVRKPYFAIVHTRLRDGHERFDQYVSKPDGLVEFMLAVVKHVAGGRAEILERMCVLDEQDKARSSHRTRRYIAEQSVDLYEPVDYLDFKFSTNADKAQAFAVIRLACRASGVSCESVRKFNAFSPIKR